MSRNLQDLVRATLRAYPDGMTPNELVDELGDKLKMLLQCLRPNSEAAPWVIDELSRISAEYEAKQEALT